jgi:hypothetical protein
MRVWGLLFLCLSLSVAHAEGSWRITKDHWSADDEQGFSRFVEAIGNTNCSSSQSCLRDPANPYRATDQHFLDIDVDCAKWPYLLRAYYAWKNGLPFSYVDAVMSTGDDRHGKGNKPAGRQQLLDRGDGINGPPTVRAVIDTVFSGTYRTDAADDRGVKSDFYSPAIQPGSIRAGTVIYDTNGHVGIVYKIDADGRIYYMDAHPDFTITRSVYGAQFGQSPARLGGGLKNWRPQLLKGAKPDDDGNLIGGHIVLADNKDIEDFSLVQYVGTEPTAKKAEGKKVEKKARFTYGGDEMPFYEWIRVVMSGGKTTYSPVYELKVTMRTLCNDLKDRAQYVNLAISENIQNQPHPSHLPDNIYDAGGEWESYATPARDSRLRAALAQFYMNMAEIIDLWVHRDPRVVYDGYDLKADLLKTYDTQSASCDLTYLNSTKLPVPLNFHDVAQRVYAISFDPYDCIELRWGADGKERETCTNGEKKLRWYEAEQHLRNDPARMTSASYDIDELEQSRKGSDPPSPVDVRALIENMPWQVPFEPMHPVGR